MKDYPSTKGKTMFFRFLGKLFFYIWIVPMLSDAVKMTSKATFDVSFEKLMTYTVKQNNAPAVRLLKNEGFLAKS